MYRFNLNNMRWWLSQFSKRLGFLGLFGFAIAICCLLFYTMRVIPSQQQKTEAALKLAELKHGSEKAILLDGLSPNREFNQRANNQIAEKDIQDFYARFPNGESLPKWLRLINERAARQHLTLNRGDYKLTQIKPKKSETLAKVNAKNALSRYEIVLPVTGQYTQIRQFIAQVLHDLPALALSDLHIERQNAQSPTVEARLVFILLLKGESWQ